MKDSQTNYDYSISLIRVVATSFIISCHIMQYLDIELAWWFNVGVQIFLCMSGVLYGKKGIVKNQSQFYKRNAIKILIDYYVVIIPVILLLIGLFPQKLSPIEIVKALLTFGTLPGGEHLWYIPYCLLCYLITPFLSHYMDGKNIVTRFVLLCVLVILVLEGFSSYFNSAWIICYIIGFFLGKILSSDQTKIYNIMALFIGVGAIISNIIQIVQDYVICYKVTGVLVLVYGKFCDYAHVALGVSLFIILKAFFSTLFKSGYLECLKKLCIYSDKYSYDIYLVHQFLILGPFSLMGLTGMLGINIILILLIVVIAAIFVNYFSNYVKRVLPTWMKA